MMYAQDKQHVPDRVELKGILSEFRDALEEEIDKIKKSGQSSTLLFGGRQIESHGADLWYRFNVEYVPSLPADTPCKLVIGKDQFDVTVISYEENSIVISTKTTLPDTIGKARLENGATVLMERLIKCIEENAEKENPAGKRMLSSDCGVYPAKKIFEYDDLALNTGNTQSQNNAIVSALSSDITYIWGPPGTGKTLLAKAVAGEAKVPFFSLAGSDFVEMFVGVGASRVRDLFKEAQKQAPCIIFIDEIDAIGKSRDTRYGGNDEREQTLNQLLAEMDGFDTSKGLLILAATNRPEVLDKALLRPGRFDRRIIVDKPDLKGRLETLKVHSKDVMMDETVDLDALALATAGLVGSDLANMINEAAINAVKNGRKFVNQADLFDAFELVAVGGKEKKDRIMSDKERKIVSYHEVGHAMVTALQKNTEPVQKITIVPRTMGALGYTLQTPEEEKYLQTKDELLAKITTYMAGRAAEMLVFGSATSGAANDIESATSIARAMVTQYGMSDKFGMMCLATVENQYLDNRAGLICGEETAAQIDQEVLSIINSSYDEAYRMLEENREVLDKISEYLYEHETITGKEFMKIFRELKGIPEPEEEEKKTFFEQAEDAKNALEQAKTEEHAKTEGQTEIKKQAETETSRAVEDQNTVSLEKGSFIDQVVDDQTAAHEEHQK